MEERYRRRRRRTVPNRRESRASLGLGRLAVAAALFLVCLLGRVCFPAQTEEYRARLAQLLAGDTDVRAAFLRMGERLEEGEATLEAVEDWCAAVFAPEEVTVEEDADASQSGQPSGELSS